MLAPKSAVYSCVLRKKIRNVHLVFNGIIKRIINGCFRVRKMESVLRMILRHIVSIREREKKNHNSEQN